MSQETACTPNTAQTQAFSVQSLLLSSLRIAVALFQPTSSSFVVVFFDKDNAVQQFLLSPALLNSITLFLTQYTFLSSSCPEYIQSPILATQVRKNPPLINSDFTNTNRPSPSSARASFTHIRFLTHSTAYASSSVLISSPSTLLSEAFSWRKCFCSLNSFGHLSQKQANLMTHQVPPPPSMHFSFLKIDAPKSLPRTSLQSFCTLFIAIPIFLTVSCNFVEGRQDFIL